MAPFVALAHFGKRGLAPIDRAALQTFFANGVIIFLKGGYRVHQGTYPLSAPRYSLCVLTAKTDESTYYECSTKYVETRDTHTTSGGKLVARGVGDKQ